VRQKGGGGNRSGSVSAITAGGFLRGRVLIDGRKG
jgi:hypothetical protein